MPTPGTPAPELVLSTLSHGEFSLTGSTAENGTVLVFYRGLHCPICMRQLTDLERHVEKFADKGVDLIAISADGREKTDRPPPRPGPKN